MNEIKEVKLWMKKCPVQTVTIFNDRAEVSRNISFIPKELGKYDVIVRGLCEYADTESLRLKGIGEFTIQDLKFDQNKRKFLVKNKNENIFISNNDNIDNDKLNDILDGVLELQWEEEKNELKSEENNDDFDDFDEEIENEIILSEDEKNKKNNLIKKLKKKLRELKKNVKLNEQKIGRLTKERSYLHKLMDNSVNSSNERCPALAKDEKHIVQPVTELFDFSFERITNIENKIYDLNEENEYYNEAIAKIQIKIESMDIKKIEYRWSRDVIISLDINNENQINKPIDLILSYLVTNCSWKPSYDIRFSSDDNSLSLSYFGLISQNTGEVWKDASLSLSTATPNKGGSPPELPQKTARYKVIQPSFRASNNQPVRRGRGAPGGGRGSGYGGMPPMEEMHVQSMLMPTSSSSLSPSMPSAPSPANVSTARVTSPSSHSATFQINHRNTIKSASSQPTKVTIAIIELSSEIIHYCAPQLAPNAYLQAKTTNTSDYLFLASDKVSVYIDGCFVTTTKLKSVSPSESFQSFLGIDPSVKVDYRPIRKSQKKQGFFNKSKTVTYEHKTIVTNTKRLPIRLTVADIYPRSNDEKIKVELIEPTKDSLYDPEEDKENDNDNDEWVERTQIHPLSNNIVFMRKLEVDEKIELPFIYSINSPQDQEIEIV